MSVLLSGADIVDTAVQTEIRGEQFYRQAAEQTDRPAARELFTYLANEEVRHRQLFQGLSSSIVTTEIDTTDIDEVMGYIAATVDRAFFKDDAPIRAVPQGATTADMLKQALDFEKQTLLFFYGLRDLVQAPNRALIDEIIAEEKRHIVRLNNMLREP